MRNNERRNISREGSEEASIAFRKTHDLVELFDLVLTVEPGWFGLQNELNYLNNFSVIYRYPGNSATKAEASEHDVVTEKVSTMS